MKIAIATSHSHPNLPDDEQLLAQALEDEGCSVRPVVWTEGEDLSSFDACVVRSTWDYHMQHERFLRWLKRVSSQTLCINPASAIAWNIDKRYLLALAKKAVPVVPTIEVEDATLIDEAFEAAASWSDYIIKPVISASSYLTKRFDRGQELEARNHLLQVLAHSAAIMQPFLHDVMDEGERSYIVIGGSVTHVIRRAPFNGAIRGELQPRIAESPRDLAVVEQTLAALPSDICYARIDVMNDSAGNALLSECELIEPSLFFLENPEAAQRLARVIASTLAVHG